MGKEARWTLTVVLLTLLFLLPVAAFNYYIDPMWTFAHENDYNSNQMPFDERQQKTNELTFHPRQYEGLLIGSSRSTYINAHAFAEKVYNYAVSNIQLPEYADYIAYARQQAGPFNTVYLGLDFYGTNASLAPNEVSPREIIQTANEPGYRWKLLASGDTLDYARKNYKASQEKQYPPNFAYDRNNVKRLSRVSLEETRQMEQEGREKYRQDIYSHYVYADVPGLLQKIQEASPESRFVAFTTPVHEDFFSLLPEMELYDAYEQWLKDCVAAFGEVYHFMYINDVTRDLANFYDGSHLYPDVAGRMIDFIEHPGATPGDFGILLTPDNIEKELERLRTRLP